MTAPPENTRSLILERQMAHPPESRSGRGRRRKPTIKRCDMSKIRIAIVHHSGFGHTARQAEAVKEGVEQVEGAAALPLTVEEAQTRWNDLSSAEAIIFGAPTYTAGASAAF
jgi:hypothetical protein